MKKLSLTLLVLFIGVTYAQAQRPQKQRTSLKQQIQNKQKLNYDDFVQEANKKYEEFRDSVNRKYAAFMEKAWKEVMPVFWLLSVEKSSLAISRKRRTCTKRVPMEKYRPAKRQMATSGVLQT